MTKINKNISSFSVCHLKSVKCLLAGDLVRNKLVKWSHFLLCLE